MDIGELLGLAREIRGESLRQVEQGTGISNAYISQIESGKVKDPSFKNAIILADFYGIKLERLANCYREQK